MFHHDIYLQEVQMTYISLTEMGDTLSAFNLPGSLGYQVKLVAREVENKDKSLTSARAFLSTTKASLSTAQGDKKIISLIILDKRMVLDRTLWRNLIHVASLT